LKSDNLTKRLYVASYVYLALPYFVFFGGWLRQPYSTLFILLLIAALVAGFRAASKLCSTSAAQDAQVSARTVALFLLPVVIVALIAGTGGWGFQSPLDSDWYKHNSILRDLVTEPWPVIYDIRNERVMLTYYVAHQLPAALAGKLWGWQAANHVLFLYTLVGLCLAALWVLVLTGTRRWWFIGVFLAFSGMDVVGQMYSIYNQYGVSPEAVGQLQDRISNFRHLEWWPGWGFAQFSSMAALINMVPNQAIPGWLFTALILKDAESPNLHTAGLFYLGLCTLWAPFVALGLFPFVVVLVFCHWRGKHYDAQTLRQVFSLLNVCGLLVGALVAIYFVARFEAYVLPIAVDGDYREYITFTFRRLPDHFLKWYFLFVMLEFAVLHGLLFWYLQLQKEPMFAKLRGLLILSACILFALPVLNWGWNNEPAMRSSIPALFVTALITIRVLGDPPRGLQASCVRLAIWGVVLVGSLNAAVEFGRQVNGVYQQGTLVAVPESGEIQTIFQIQEEKYRKYYNFAAQYVGSADSFFVRHFAKQ
jgi:hypothetical protein